MNVSVVVALSLSILCTLGAFLIFRAGRSELEPKAPGAFDPSGRYFLAVVACSRCSATAKSVFREVGGRHVPTRLAPGWGTLLREQPNPDDGLTSAPLCPKCCARSARSRGRSSR